MSNLKQVLFQKACSEAKDVYKFSNTPDFQTHMNRFDAFCEVIIEAGLEDELGEWLKEQG